jgi:hypothetical protein
MIEWISEILSKLIVLDEEDSSKNLELVEYMWNVNLTMTSMYWIICLSWTFGCRDS